MNAVVCSCEGVRVKFYFVILEKKILFFLCFARYLYIPKMYIVFTVFLYLSIYRKRHAYNYS